MFFSPLLWSCDYLFPSRMGKKLLYSIFILLVWKGICFPGLQLWPQCWLEMTVPMVVNASWWSWQSLPHVFGPWMTYWIKGSHLLSALHKRKIHFCFLYVLAFLGIYWSSLFFTLTDISTWTYKEPARIYRYIYTVFSLPRDCKISQKSGLYLTNSFIHVYIPLVLLNCYNMGRTVFKVKKDYY